MREKLIVFFILLCAMLAAGQKSGVFAQTREEGVSITTYYPSPHAVFRFIRLVPTAAPAADAGSKGLLYYNDTASEIQSWNGTNWTSLGGGGGGLWAQNGTFVYPVNSTSPNIWNVSIGNNTTLYQALFRVAGGIFRDGAAFAGNKNAIETQVNLGIRNDSWTGTEPGKYSGSEGRYVTISGGWNFVGGEGGTVTGGHYNDVEDAWQTITGGKSNNIHHLADGTISGGEGNTGNDHITLTHSNATVSCGQGNEATGSYSTVTGGNNNVASGYQSVVTGGRRNQATGENSTVSGGENNTASGYGSTVGGGQNNTASGEFSVVPGGFNNTASGNISFAAGTSAQATHDGSFVWADHSSTDPYFSRGPNTFNIRATKGFYFQGNTTTPAGSPLYGNDTVSDVAEFFDSPSAQRVAAGQLVSITGDNLVGRSSAPYEERLIGVVTGRRTCSFFMGSEKGGEGITRVAVSLAGPVFCLVNNESGPIKSGDAITSSSVPGEGMKAVATGRIVGYAMQAKDCPGAQPCEALVFVRPGYHVEENEMKGLQEEVAALEKRYAELKQRKGR